MTVLIKYDPKKNPQQYVIAGVPLADMTAAQFGRFDLATRKQILEQPWYTEAKKLPAKVDPAVELAKLKKAAEKEGVKDGDK